MKKFLIISVSVVLILCVLTVSGGLIAYASITKNAEIHNNLLPQTSVNTVFYDVYGNALSGTSDEFATYDELPQNLIAAVVALEDKRFYKHKGVDYIRTGGALINNIKNKGFYEGGSTITQQLIKNTHLSQDKTVKRKLNEIKLAKQLEMEYSKEEILEMYFNVVYFGGGMYGIKSASKGLFNKTLDKLTLSECAALVAILKNPSKYSPAVSVEKSEKRRNTVLELMYAQGFISETEKTAAQKQPTVLDKSATFANTRTYTLSATAEAAKILNMSVQSFMSAGFSVSTYLEPEKQNMLTEIIGNPEYYPMNERGVRGEGAGIILDNSSAGISACFATKKRNMWELCRPYGSTAKPIIVYAPSFQYNLITAATPVLDEKTDFSGYMPSNYNDVYSGWTDIRNSVKTSSNVIAVKTYNMLGYERCKIFASSIGINLTADDNNATLALGNLSGKHDFIELTGGYSMLANGGNYSAPSFIYSITDKNGNFVYQRNIDNKSVMSEENAYILTDILADTAENGTARALKNVGFEVAAKTGTIGNSLGNTDAYCVGYTSADTFLVWHGNSTGNSENDMTLKETGGSYAARSLRDLIKNVYSGRTPNAFKVPNGIITENIDGYAVQNLKKLLLSTENTPTEYIHTELFTIDNAPTEFSNCFDNYEIRDMKAEISDGIVNITFENSPYMYFDIMRGDDVGITLVQSYSPQKNTEKIYFADYCAPSGKFVKYYIKPYFYNQFGIKIVGNVAETDSFYINYNNFDFVG